MGVFHLLILLSPVVGIHRDTVGSTSIQAEAFRGAKVGKRAMMLTGQTFARDDIPGAPLCGESIPEVSDATWAFTARDGSTVTYTCDVGFKTSKGQTQFSYSCTSGEPISSALLPDECIQVECPKPAPIEHSDMIWQLGKRVSTGGFGSVVDFACEKGYTGDGKAHGPKVVKMICSENGEYEFVLETVTSCKLITCDKPIEARNAVLDPALDRFSPVSYNSSVTYSCASGYTSSSVDKAKSFTLTCGEDGEFIPNDPLPHCIEEVCPELPALEHSDTVHVAGDVKVGTRVLYRCTDGFFVSRVPASSTFNIMCEMVNGKPAYVVPPPERRCRPAPCLPLPSLLHAHVDATQTEWNYQDIVRFSCEDGYALGGVKGDTTFAGYCNTQGLWTIADNPKCAPVICGAGRGDVPPDMLQYGKMAEFSTSPIHFEMSTTVQCIPGAVVTGTGGMKTQFELLCGSDGEFTSDGLCAIPCPPVPKVAHSTSKYFGKVIEYGGPAAKVTCKEGFKTKNGESVQELTCGRDGNLTPVDECLTDTGYESPWEYREQNNILHDGQLVNSATTTGWFVGFLVLVVSAVFI